MRSTLSLSQQQFTELARTGNVIPVYKEIIADLETPVSAYAKIREGDHSFLFESVEAGGKFARYSFLGSDPHFSVCFRGNTVTKTLRKGEPVTYQSPHDCLREMENLMKDYRPVAQPELPLFYGGLVGFLSFEVVTTFEPVVSRAKTDDLQLPDAYFFLADTVLIFDHELRTIKILANTILEEGELPELAYNRAVSRILSLEALLEKPSHKARTLPKLSDPQPLEPRVNMTRDEYVRMTEAMQDYIRAGDIFQVVPSQRFEVDFTGQPLDLYRALRLVNPSPYMICMELPGMALVGASPELHVRCEQGKVQIRPIAGTYRRGSSEEEDARLAAAMLADPKERAEHVMLVDLARNDVGRVCEFNTVSVTDFMIAEKYSHVMHIVSNVEGTLQEGHSAYDVMRATFPAGTVSGSPKIRAMQIIAEQEPTCRGSYAGAIGYFGFSGNLDSCIGIRTALLKDGKAYVQAGGGLVADSTPLGEYQESVNKAKAALKALAIAKAFL
jgi:anthranilate synthase component 1